MADITTTDELRTVYRNPAGPAVAKQHAALDEHDRSFIAHAPFVIVATTDADGRCDVSPKGGPPGFVRVLADGTVAVPDLSGNNRLDSLQNLLDNPGIGLLFLIPGIDETLRVNGRARLSTDPDVLAAATVNGAVPKVAIAVEVEEAFIHCAKALRRGAVWQHNQWPDTSDMPKVAEMLRDQAAPEFTVEQVELALEDGYQKTLWQTGG